MSSPSPARLHATTAGGTTVLSVVDFSSGGLLVESPTPFSVGDEVHVRLSTASGVFAGTFTVRCLHSHRSGGHDTEPRHLSALLFVHPPDAVRETLAHLWATPTAPPPPQRALRLVDTTT